MSGPVWLASLDVEESPVVAPLGRSSIGRVVLAVCKAPAQVLFQNNLLAGVVVVIGIAVASWVAAADFLLGALLATLVARAVGADQHMTDEGLFGFSGGYVALLVGTFADQGTFPGPTEVVFLLAVGSVLAVPLTVGLGQAFGRLGLSPTALPILVLVWFTLASIAYTDLNKLEVAPPLYPVDQRSGNAYTFETWFEGIGNGFAQVFAQHHVGAGYLILLAILLHSRVAAAMGLGGAAIGIAVPSMLGFDEAMVRSGVMAFNPALTAIGLGGFFLALSWRAVGYALVAAVLSIWVFVAMAAILGVIGLPAMTIGMVVTIAVMVLAAQPLPHLQVVALEALGRPEDGVR